MTDAATAPAPRHAFPLLDGARGLVALAVLGFHCAAALQLTQAFPFAYLGVDFFFMLSGFVIGHAYEDKLKAGGYLTRFAEARLVRLYPMIAVGTLIGFALVPIAHRPLLALGAGLALFPRGVGPAGDLVFPLDAALWSLFFELLANAVYALAVRRAGMRTLAAVCLLTAPLIVLGGSFHVGWETQTFWLGFPRTAFSFSIGLILFRLHRAGRLPDWSRAAPWLIVALAAALALPLPLAHGRFAVLWLYVVGLFPATIVSLVALRPGPRAAWWSALSGEISYPLYAIHVPLVMATGAAITAHVASWESRVAAACALMLAVPLLALLLSRAVDAPVRTWLAVRIRRLRSLPRLADPAPAA